MWKNPKLAESVTYCTETAAQTLEKFYGLLASIIERPFTFTTLEMQSGLFIGSWFVLLLICDNLQTTKHHSTLAATTYVVEQPLDFHSPSGFTLSVFSNGSIAGPKIAR